MAGHAQLLSCDLVMLRGHPDGRTSWVFRHQRVNTANVQLDIVPIAGKGLGVVAMRAFVCGERILTEAPLVSWESAPNMDGVHDWCELLHRIDALDDASWCAFYDLCDKRATSNSYIADALRTADARASAARAIWNSNSFPTEVHESTLFSKRLDRLDSTSFADLQLDVHQICRHCAGHPKQRPRVGARRRNPISCLPRKPSSLTCLSWVVGPVERLLHTGCSHRPIGVSEHRCVRASTTRACPTASQRGVLLLGRRRCTP